MLKHSYASLEEIPEAARSFYAEAKDGKFYITVEGLVPKVKLDEFRTNTTTLLAKIKSYTDIIGEDDDSIARVKELVEKDRAGEIQIGKPPRKDEIDGIVNEKIGAYKKDAEKKIADLTASVQSITAKLENEVVTRSLAEAASKRGVLPTAIDDVVARGRAIFKMKDGAAIPLSANGETILGKDGFSPKSVDEWMEELPTTAPHFFPANKGSGAGDGQRFKGTGTGDGVNPWKPGATFNLTKQGQITKENPELAKSLKAQAGVA
jgi:hypothetical protein